MIKPFGTFQIIKRITFAISSIKRIGTAPPTYLDTGFSQKLTCSKNFLCFFRISSRNLHPITAIPRGLSHTKHGTVPFSGIVHQLSRLHRQRTFPPFKSSRILRELFNVQMPHYAVHLNQARGAKRAGIPTDNHRGGEAYDLIPEVNAQSRRAWPLPSSKGWMFCKVMFTGSRTQRMTYSHREFLASVPACYLYPKTRKRSQ